MKTGRQTDPERPTIGFVPNLSSIFPEKWSWSPSGFGGGDFKSPWALQDEGSHVQSTDACAIETQFSIWSCGKSVENRKYPIWGLSGSAGPILPQIRQKKVAQKQKLCRTVQIHRELTHFNCHLPQKTYVFIFMFFGTIGNVHDPQNPSFLTLDTPDHSKES